MARSKEMIEVEVGDGRLCVARWRGDGPPILLVHGITGSHHAWSRVAAEPALAGFDLIAPEFAAHLHKRVDEPAQQCGRDGEHDHGTEIVASFDAQRMHGCREPEVEHDGCCDHRGSQCRGSEDGRERHRGEQHE